MKQMYHILIGEILMARRCPYCSSLLSDTEGHLCHLCHTWSELCYHQRSLKQMKMWKREIFTDDEYDIDSFIEFDEKMLAHYKLTLNIILSERKY